VEHGEFSIQGQWIRDTHGTELLRAIERFIKSRKNDKKIWETLNSLRWVEKSGMRCDIAGIKPDFLFLPRCGNVCYLVENKPFYSSSLTGNQIPESVFPQVHTFPSSLAAYILSKPAHYLTS
jgi:hypothetical protein